MTSHTEWSLKVSDDDLLLILKSLGGRIATVDERAAAERLGDRLTELKANRLALLGDMAGNLYAALDAKGYEPPVPKRQRERHAHAGESAALERVPR